MTTRRRSTRPTRSTPRVLAYLRCSTAEQADSGAGLSAQRAALESEASRRGWDDVTFMTDAGYSAKSLDRPAIREALAMLAAGDADTLVVSRLDRLSRSVLDFSQMMARSKAEGWSMVALDISVDTSTPTGEAMVNVMCAFAQMERQIIGARTREALATRKAAGVRLGRMPVLAHDVETAILGYRASGLTYEAIANRLNSDNVPTAGGGQRWYPMSVHKVVQRLARPAPSTKPAGYSDCLTGV